MSPTLVNGAIYRITQSRALPATAGRGIRRGPTVRYSLSAISGGRGDLSEWERAHRPPPRGRRQRGSGRCARGSPAWRSEKTSAGVRRTEPGRRGQLHPQITSAGRSSERKVSPIAWASPPGSAVAGMPAWYREAFLAHDPKNPGEFVARVLNMLGDQLSDESGPEAPFPP